MPTDEERKELAKEQADMFEILKEFEAEGGALCEYIAWNHEPERLCETCPCKTDNTDKCILVIAQNLIEKWEDKNNA